MTTDELTLLLSGVQQPVDAQLLNRLTWGVAVVSLLSVAMLVVVTLGPRADLSAGFVQANALLGASLALVALLAFERSLRPGRATGGRLALMARQGVPVQPRLAGACAGLGSAGLATIAYSLHCLEDSAPFIASWYWLAMACTAALGAMTFPRLARW